MKSKTTQKQTNNKKTFSFIEPFKVCDITDQYNAFSEEAQEELKDIFYQVGGLIQDEYGFIEIDNIKKSKNKELKELYKSASNDYSFFYIEL